MFGKKKEKPVVEEPPTPVQKAGMEKKGTEIEEEQLKALVEEFQNTYMPIVGEKDLENVSAEVLSLNLLFAIYGELRLARLQRLR